ncbi:hypothetical protein P3K77_02690 [Bacillus cytotoxicus]|uniref:Uncharacterized protein n=1 Tax=Bacillus cytotoxicus TaxID=580165 RepID=A0AAX2CG08_9BACI|nr:Protein of unknown function [Bacillus cytotoxicus]
MARATFSPAKQLVENAIFRKTFSTRSVRRPLGATHSYRSVKTLIEQQELSQTDLCEIRRMTV